MNTSKSFDISKHVVWEAYKRVKANNGAAGVDEQSIKDFEANLKNNLYKLWNRMSSGSYFPDAVRRVEIPKGDGGMRQLGIPTVADRIAQMVAKMTLEPKLDLLFHTDSYGYRPNKSALDAVSKARKRCWQYAWVVDLDIRGFFDNLDHALLMRAVQKHTDCKWLLLYIERWLTAPMETVDGHLIRRTRGIPQGGVISPLLSNLFLHYALDIWLTKHYPTVVFERYADDMIVHCHSQLEAERVMKGIAERLHDCKLELHPVKTKIVYCKDERRQHAFSQQQFDFLGYTFRPRLSKSRKGKFFEGFNPAVSKKAAKAMKQTMRSWSLHKKCNRTITEIAQWINPILKGWINYYGRFRRTALNRIFAILNVRLMKWAKWKYKKLKGHGRRAMHWLGKIAKQNPNLFAHWQIGVRPGDGQ